MNILILFLMASMTWAKDFPPLRKLVPDESVIRADLDQILSKARLQGEIEFSYMTGQKNQSRVICSKDKVHLEVEGNERWGQTFYMTLQRLGFFFPHPRIQISPTKEQLRNQCGKSFEWRPALPYYGFHLHTLHPSEWMEGFVMGKTPIALDLVKWLARNQQNIFDFSLLKMDNETIFKNVKAPFELAKKMGIHAGLTMGMAFHQQKSYKLIPLFATFFDSMSLSYLEENLENLLNNIDVSYLNLESGTSEFTPANYERTIKWMNRSAEIAKKHQVSVLMKIHTSSNQKDPVLGNYNFLPSKASPEVGILPHTVYIYSLEDEFAPMYGNKNFSEIKKFLLQEKDKRRTWFYPETSYYLGLDIDVPLLLTDFLLTRARDTKFLYQNGVDGQLNFSTGQEVGFWLYDWSYTLFNNLDYQFDPLIGLKFLGENADDWQKIIDFEHERFIKDAAISIVTFPSLGDELMPGLHQTLKRNLLGTLSEDKTLLEGEISLLELTLFSAPAFTGIKNEELRALWNLTSLRISHAIYTRKALLYPEKKEAYLKQAKETREMAQLSMDFIFKYHNRYPETHIFDTHENPTAYQFGYLYSAKDLYYWRREEESVQKNNFSWTFMRLHSYWNLFRGWVLSE